jgi:hypothetical protein
MKRSSRRWFVAVAIVLGFIVVGKAIGSDMDTVDPLGHRVSQIRNEISQEKCVNLAQRGLLSAVLQKAGISLAKLYLR